MSTIAVWFSKIGLALAMVGGILLPLPMQVSASTLSEGTPPATPVPANDRLERVWGREQRIYARLGRFFDHSDERLAKAQQLIDNAASNGKDVSGVQSALDALSAAIKQARPVYEGGKGIVVSHKGFDADGKVVDADQARQTVQDLRAKLQAVRQLIADPAQALKAAIKAFRDANPPKPSPTPAASGG